MKTIGAQEHKSTREFWKPHFNIVGDTMKIHRAQVHKSTRELFSMRVVSIKQ